jgi:hypothetical protein
MNDEQRALRHSFAQRTLSGEGIDIRPYPGVATPGARIVAAGLRDLAADKQTVPALLVAQMTPRLRDAGFDVPAHVLPDAETHMYRLLAAGDPDGANDTLTALRELLVSYCCTIEREHSRGQLLRRGQQAVAAHEAEHGPDSQREPDADDDAPRSTGPTDPWGDPAQ